jgi:spore germination protein KC
MFFGYVEYFLIGEDAAKDDISKYTDFISRDHEVRFTPTVFITKGSSAKEYIQKTSTGGKFIADRLANIKDDISLFSNTKEVKLIDLMSALNDPDTPAILPALTMLDFNDVKSTGETPEKNMDVTGYAVIKDYKLAGYIEDSISLGYNILTNQVRSFPLMVKDDSGNKVALEVIKANTKVEAEFDGDTLKSITYHTSVISNIDEVESRDNVFTNQAFDELNLQQSQAIQSVMEEVIGVSKKYQTDCISLGEKIRMQHPLKWKKIKSNWPEIYTNLEINVSVHSEIAGTYKIREPIGYKTGV